MNRRRFLSLLGTTGLGAGLASCNFPRPTPQDIPVNPVDTKAAIMPSVTPQVTLIPVETATVEVVPVSTSFQLPLLMDFSSFPGQALPGWFNGSTWKLIGGFLANQPVLGEELLVDPGLEAEYVDGMRCQSLTAVGNSILKQSSDAHSGLKSQLFQSNETQSVIYWAPQTAESGAWYQFSIWARCIAGSGANTRMVLAQRGGLPVAQAEWAITSPVYQQGRVSLLSTSQNELIPCAAKQVAEAGLGDVVLVDDGSFRKIEKSSLFGFLPPTQADIVIKTKIDILIDNTQVGLVLRADSAINPERYLLVLVSAQVDVPQNGILNVLEVNGSSYTLLVENALLGSQGSDAWLEVRASGNSLSVFYDHKPVGSEILVSATEIATNTLHGVFSTGSNRLKSLYAAEKLVSRVQVYAGSSFTASDGYRLYASAYCLSNYPQYDYDFPVLAIGKHNTWSNLVRFTTGGDVLILDHANDQTASLVEAMLRRVWSANPSTQIILISSPSWYTRDINEDSLVNAPANLSMLLDIQALAGHYGVALVDYWMWCMGVVNSGVYHLSQLTDDTIHPSKIGYEAMASLLEYFLPVSGTAMPPVLPERYFPESVFFEAPPVRIVGTDYFERTGSGWVDDGTTISSATPGDTVTYATKDLWSSFGGWRSDGKSNLVEISLNGGPFEQMPFHQNGYPMYAAIYDTITIRIPDGGYVRIEEVWLI